MLHPRAKVLHRHVVLSEAISGSMALLYARYVVRSLASVSMENSENRVVKS